MAYCRSRGSLLQKARLLYKLNLEGWMQMKRLGTLVALLVAVAVTSVALAAGGLGKFKTKITGTGPKTDHGMVDGTWTIDLRSPPPASSI